MSVSVHRRVIAIVVASMSLVVAKSSAAQDPTAAAIILNDNFNTAVDASAGSATAAPVPTPVPIPAKPLAISSSSIASQAISTLKSRIASRIDHAAPSRTAPATWCTIKAVPGQSRCDAGAAVALISRESVIFPGHYFVIPAFLGKSTLGSGLAWEVRRYVPPPANSPKPMRIFIGPTISTRWSDTSQLKFNLGIGAAIVF